MRWARQFVFCIGLFVAGYAAAWLPIFTPSTLRAEPGSESATSAVRSRVHDADRALADAMQALQDEKLYVPAISGINAFAISVGGVDAIADLESGQGVDPETFAGLYAGQAVQEIADRLSHDAEGRLMYKNRIVRMYNATRLKQLFAARAELMPIGAVGSKKEAAAKNVKEEEPAAEKSKGEKGKDEKAKDE
jgi:hypothetical protein